MLNKNSTASRNITETFLFSGRGAHFTTVPIDSPDSPNCGAHNDVPPPPRPPMYSNATHVRSFSESNCRDRTLPKSTKFKEAQEFFQRNGSSPVKNGCTSTRENLLAKTDVAMSSLLMRLDQVAAQCSVAQVHGGGRMMCEEKFQVNLPMILTLFYV